MKRALALAITLSTATLSSTPALASHLGGYAAPTGLSATVTGDDVTLAWTSYPAENFPANCTQAREIRIFRNVNGGDFALIFSAAEADTMYSDDDLAAGTYQYKIQARCNVPAVPGPGGSPADANNLSVFSAPATAEVTSAPACTGAPTVVASASPTLLWPPNGKLVPVTITGTVTAAPNCSLPESITYSVVDEYGENSAGPFPVALSNGAINFQVGLEASRRGDDLDGRLYTIQLDVPGDTDGWAIDVTVPHDQRKK